MPYKVRVGFYCDRCPDNNQPQVVRAKDIAGHGTADDIAEAMGGQAMQALDEAVEGFKQHLNTAHGRTA